MTRLLPLFSLACGLVACGGSSSTQPTPDAATGEVYAVATSINDNTAAATSLIFTLGSLGAGVVADKTKAIPIADTVSLFGKDGAGQVFSTQAMTPIVTRYDVAMDGTITANGTLSFANFGLGTTYSTRSIVFISNSKAYLLDDTTLQAIVFDPSQMVVGKAIDLSAMAVTNYHTDFSYNIPQRGTQVVVVGYYYDSSYAKTTSTTSIALIDSTTDTATFVTDTRCGAFSTAVTASDGDIYFGSDSYAAAISRVGGSAQPGCLLRMKSGANLLDPTYDVAVTSLTNGKSGGGVVPAAGDALFTRVLDETLYKVTDATSATVLLAAPAWRWWMLDLTSGTGPAVVSTLPAGTGEVKYFSTGGHSYAGSSASDYTTSSIIDMTATGGPSVGATVTGFPSGIVKAH